MKTLSKILLVAATSAVAMSASAAVTYGKSNAGQPYVGVKVGQVDADVVGAPKSVNYGVYGGYNFDQNFGAEVEYTGSEAKDYTVGNAKYEYDVKSFGAYGTYRYHLNATPFYAKGKLGVANTKIEDKRVDGTNSFSKVDKTGLAGGVGLGYSASQNFGIEAGYNYLSEDANSISLGAHLAF